MTRGNGVIGKWLGQTVYVHRSALKWLPPQYYKFATAALERSKAEQAGDYNVIKVDLRKSRVSMLTYPCFRTDPFPALATSVTVDGQGHNRRVRRYADSQNPPILHRKELLLPSDDPDRQRFAQLTEALERAGMYRHPKSIGFRDQWSKRLVAAGLRIENHCVIEQPDDLFSAQVHPW